MFLERQKCFGKKPDEGIIQSGVCVQAVILAGGKGSRLRPITYQVPKPMVPVHGKPFLLYQLELIRSFDINKVLLLVGYLGRQIEEYFGDGSRFSLRIEYSYEESLLGTGGALKNAEEKLPDDFLLINGDTYLPIDYSELIKYYKKFSKIGVITAYNNSDKIAPNNIAVGASNEVVGYNKRDTENMTHVDSGVMILKKNILDNITENKPCSLEEEIFPELISRKELVAYIIRKRFYDIGSLKELNLVQRVLK